ncbi:Putative DUF21-domain-containing protein [Rhizopus microsporus]|nr:Putative DUF21-domain-containing protein [Rhizopus microsporus]
MLYRPQTIGSIRTFTLALVSLTSSIYGHPLSSYSASEADEPEIDYGSPAFYEKMAIIMFLVLLGGVFAGLTLGLMGMDETNLHVLIQSGTETEKTLPIILDGVLGGGWKAVVISTALIVIFGEVIPQSVCVRYGLAIGAKTAGMVLALMYLMYPIAYPTALLLDYFLGESHGTIYKKAGLKTLVSLHQSVNPADVDALTEDEVTIIGAVLDLRQKPVSQIMTPIADVFTLSTDDILNEETVEKILTAGYSRIPVHAPGDSTNFVGMLLTKRLITYDPEDARPVKDFQISTLPETGPDTSCLDILNFFQEGKSHMALISNDPGGQTGALGVITLEDVIEELIGEEIIDETDVYVDVHNKIRVVRRQVTNSRKNSQLTRLLTAHKRQTHQKVPVRENSVGSIKRETSQHKKVVEPFLKPVYGTITDENMMAASPEPHESLLKSKMNGESEPLLKK